MSLENHILKLKEKHASLELCLEREQKRSYQNHYYVSLLKQHKLRIKDELAFLSSAWNHGR